ncbi:MAG: multicopper oxidase family protein [Bacillota bacterium]
MKKRPYWLAGGAAALVLAVVLIVASITSAGGGSGSTQPTPTDMAGMNHDSAPTQSMRPHEYTPTEGKGGQMLSYTLDGDTKVFELTAKEVMWEVSPGRQVQAWTWNGTVPGPVIRVTEGDRVRIIVHNELPEPTTLHSHGLDVPFEMDGVSGVTQDPIPTGGTFTYEFVAKPAGTHLYHSHHNSAKQVSMGLYGAFIVDPKKTDIKADRDYTMTIGDAGLGFTLNGKSFPATEPLQAKMGETIRLRLINVGEMIHPMHLHGQPFTVIAKDGYPLPQPQKMDTVTVAPGETYDLIIKPNGPGNWAFHCHILTHAEDAQGMMGLTTTLNVAP